MQISLQHHFLGVHKISITVWVLLEYVKKHLLVFLDVQGFPVILGEMSGERLKEVTAQ